MPTNASGRASARQTPRFFVPMPGSISTMTAPTLNSANVRAKNSRLGVTISTVRVPRRMPICSKPRASASLSAFSSR
jgi:hypothetical protein